MRYKVEYYNEEFNYFRCRGNSGVDAETINLELSTAINFGFYKDIKEDNIIDKRRMLSEQLIGKVIEVGMVVPWISFGEDIKVIGEG